MIKVSLKEYLEKSRELDEVRSRNKGEESPEEDEILEQLDDLWWALTSEERNEVETQ